MTKRTGSVATLAAVLLMMTMLQGCFLAPSIDSMRRAGITAEARRGLLADRVKMFHQALYWKRSDDALMLVTAEQRDALAPELRSIVRHERVVESKVESVTYDDDAMNASVEVVVKAYKVPFYVVNERLEAQEWKFSFSDGWQLESREVRPYESLG